MRTTSITYRICGSALLTASFFTATAPAQSPAAELERTRSALETWVETRKTISAERRDARLGSEVLADRIALLEREIQAQRQSIAEVEQSIAESTTKYDELVARDTELTAAAERGLALVGEAARRTATLLPRLPVALRERIAPLSRRLDVPVDADSAPSLGERARDLVGILNAANRDQSDVTISTEIRTLEDGRAAEVHVLRLGLAQAFYVSSDGKFAGFGVPAEDGWQWTEDSAAAPEIAAAVAILQSERTAAFVALPVRIR